jgi:glucose/arabinose dehydrogenase
MKFSILSITILFFSFSILFSQQTSLVTRNVKTGLDTPWEIIWGPDNWIWLTERLGKISRINPETGEQKIIVSKLGGVTEISESGLMGMALHPNFKDTSWVYIAYTYLLSGSTLGVKIERYTYRNDSLLQPIKIIDGIKGYSTHDGCRLLISNDRKLFITTGDAQDQPSAQNSLSLNGKTLRLNLDGSIPLDNPFSNAVWSKGHRNAQGIVLTPNGLMYQSEHGPDNDDEINLIIKGRNYGWPTVMGFCDNALETTFCKDSNVVEPLKVWTPTLAVCGMDYYNLNLIPEWNGCLILTTLKASKLVVLKLSPDGKQIESERTYFTGGTSFGRLRDLCVSPDGRIFIGTSNLDGRGTAKQGDDKIIEIKPKGTTDINNKNLIPLKLELSTENFKD